jgi:hypothetical protein
MWFDELPLFIAQFSETHCYPNPGSDCQTGLI